MTETTEKREFENLIVIALGFKQYLDFCRIIELDHRKTHYLKEVYDCRGRGRGIPYVKLPKYYMHKDHTIFLHEALINEWEDVTDLFKMP